MGSEEAIAPSFSPGSTRGALHSAVNEQLAPDVVEQSLDSSDHYV